MIDTVTREQLHRRLQAGDPPTLVEALPERHYRDAHLPGAVNIPHDEIRSRAPAQLPDKDAAIVVYCANAACRNSRIAADALVDLGYSDVAVYEAGKEDWVEAGLPVESGAPAAAGTA